MRALIDALWDAQPSKRKPLLIANDENPDAAYWRAMLPAAGAAVNVASWHLYCGYGLDPDLPANAWDPEFLACPSRTAAPQVAAAAPWRQATGGQVWIGESAMAWHSGRENTTDSFLSSPWFVAQLGQLAASHAVQCRQTLVGGYYELLDRQTFAPNPDYWLALVWKRAMGARVLGVGSSDARVLGYAHCQRGGSGVSFAFVNTAATPAQLSLGGFTSERWDYVLTAASADNRTVALNGAPLVYAGGQLSPLAPAVSNGAAPLVVPPFSVGFATFPKETVAACA